jgi:hypothetical protein
LIIDPETCNDCVFEQTEACAAPKQWFKYEGVCKCAEEKVCELPGVPFRKLNPETCDCFCENKRTTVCNPETEFFNDLTCDCMSRICDDAETCGIPIEIMNAIDKLSEE